MARTWSNAEKIETISAAQRARRRPSALSGFAVALAVITLFFLGLTFYTAYRAVTHPPTQKYAPPEDK